MAHMGRPPGPHRKSCCCRAMAHIGWPPGPHRKSCSCRAMQPRPCRSTRPRDQDLATTAPAPNPPLAPPAATPACLLLTSPLPRRRHWQQWTVRDDMRRHVVVERRLQLARELVVDGLGQVVDAAVLNNATEVGDEDVERDVVALAAQSGLHRRQVHRVLDYLVVVGHLVLGHRLAEWPRVVITLHLLERQGQEALQALRRRLHCAVLEHKQRACRADCLLLRGPPRLAHARDLSNWQRHARLV
mmetsp:Transcript_12959/g.37613  ORF Transcript_12959/g.37613 Transcript_12959/m.37613 type:complete len:244 (+) Transcript_12959:361-1092(+)